MLSISFLRFHPHNISYRLPTLRVGISICRFAAVSWIRSLLHVYTEGKSHCQKGCEIGLTSELTRTAISVNLDRPHSIWTTPSCALNLRIPHLDLSRTSFVIILIFNNRTNYKRVKYRWGNEKGTFGRCLQPPPPPQKLSQEALRTRRRPRPPPLPPLRRHSRKRA